jgi:hypothetical protein
MATGTDKTCPICKAELYSITTRQIIGQSVCRDCGDKITPLVDALNTKLFNKIMWYMKEEPNMKGLTLEESLYSIGAFEGVDEVTMAILQGQR